MNRSELRLRFSPDDEYTGDLAVDVKSDGFSGSGRGHFDTLEVKETFVAALRVYPLIADRPPMLEAGFYGHDGLFQCHLRLTVTPYNVKGHLLVCVELTSPGWDTCNLHLQQMVTARYLTSYGAVARFADELEAVLDSKVWEAVLPGEDFL